VNQRAAARYKITLVEAKSAAGFHLNVKINEAFDEWTKISEGAYALKTNITDWSDEKLWGAYIQLAQAEAAFRVQKDALSIRPIWHQRADRVEAHILVCSLAFVLWKTLELWQRRAELGNSPAHRARGDQAHSLPRCVFADHHSRGDQAALRDAAR